MRKFKISDYNAILVAIVILLFIAIVSKTMHDPLLTSPQAPQGDSPSPLQQGSGVNSSESKSSPAAPHIFDDLLDAIEQVESGGDANAIGDNGNAIGSFQIWEIYVSDVNRISGKQYKFSDRYSREKSKEMVRTYLSHYGGTIEEMARKHNGGPQGHKKASTLKYWEKIKAELRRVENEQTPLFNNNWHGGK